MVLSDIGNLLVRLSDMKNLEVTVLFEGNVDNTAEISYDDARLLCSLQNDFGKSIRPKTSKEINRYNSLKELDLLNQLETGEYRLTGVAQRARYLIN